MDGEGEGRGRGRERGVGDEEGAVVGVGGLGVDAFSPLSITVNKIFDLTSLCPFQLARQKIRWVRQEDIS